ncbi:hepatic and glial cell adhesion molecule-like [Anableps anableps]
MELIAFFSLLAMMIGLSPAEEVKRNLTGVVGGNITLPDPLLELGFLLDKLNTVASVDEEKFKILEERYNKRLDWNKNSGLFTLTDLQKEDSGLYEIDAKKTKITFSYSLTVYDPAPTPAVETQTVSSDSCWLICSVDKQASLLWIKDQDILNQSRSALSLPVTVRKEDRGSSYRCVAANPAENKTLHVNVTTSCGFNDTESLDNFEKRTYWIAGGICSVFLALVVVGVWVIKQRYLSKKKPFSHQLFPRLVDFGLKSSLKLEVEVAHWISPGRVLTTAPG